MSRLTKNEELGLLADFHTGGYSQRELARKYHISLGKVNQLIKGLTPKNEHLMNATKSVIKASEELPEKEMNAIVNKAKQELNKEQIIYNATLKNLSLMIKKVNEGTSIVEHKVVQDTIDKASITLNVNQRHSNQQINLTNATQTNIEVNKELVKNTLIEFEDEF